MYNVTEYQYQQLKNYYPNCSVIAEIGRQPQKEESPNTNVQQLKAEIAALVAKCDTAYYLGDDEGFDSCIETMRQLSAV